MSTNEFYSYETKGGKERERQQSAYVDSEFFGSKLADTYFNREKIVNICLEGMSQIASPTKSELFYIGLLKSFKHKFDTPTAPLPSQKQIDALYSFLTSYQAAKYINEYQIKQHIGSTVTAEDLLKRIEVLEKAVAPMASQMVTLATQVNEIVNLLKQN